MSTHPANQEYWDRCMRGEFSLQRCLDCREWRFPPSSICPRCLSEQVAWEQPSGRGTLFSWIRIHQRYFAPEDFDLPYEVAMVELDDGPAIIAGFSAATADPPEIGSAVEVVLEEDRKGRVLPRFQPVRESGDG